MSFSSLLTDTVDIYRAQAGPGIQTTYGTTPYESGVSCLIQPVIGEYFAKTGMSYGRTYNAFFTIDTDIMLTDRIVDENGKIYQVTATFYRDYGAGDNQHLTCTLTEEPVAGPDL